MVRRATAYPERQAVAEQPISTVTREELPARIYSHSLGVTIQTRPPKPAEIDGYSSSSSSSDDDDETTSTMDEQHPDPKTKTTVITADVLIPGAGEPQKDAALVIQDKIIAWVGPKDSIPKKYTSRAGPSRTHHVPVVMPGLWDVHVHVDAEPPQDEQENPAARISTHPATAGAQLAKGCWEALQRGYTSMRDLAGLGCEIARAIDSGAVVGPNIYAAGACLSQTGGHGDIFEVPAGDALLNLGVGAASLKAGTQYAGGSSVLVDGVDECRRGVRLQIRRGARCIKIMASGGVGSRDDDVFCAQFSREELECIVEEAARQKISCAAHVHSKEGIMAAVEAGVRSVEHVSFADEECVELIKKKKVIWVATRTVVQILMESKGRGLPRNVWSKLKKVSGANLAAYKMAIADGNVTFALGTDMGPGFNMAMELDYAVKAGMTNLQAIQAATANGPLVLGEKAPLSGQLKVGYEADVLGVMENPVDDVKVLMKKDNIGWVWKGGKLFKGPGVGPWGEDE